MLGYKKQKPVRNGNNAAHQFQLDVFGELLDSLYLYDRYFAQLPFEFWNTICKMLDWLVNNWDRPDAGESFKKKPTYFVKEFGKLEDKEIKISPIQK